MLFDQRMQKLDFTQQYPAHHELGLENPVVLKNAVSKGGLSCSVVFER